MPQTQYWEAKLNITTEKIHYWNQLYSDFNAGEPTDYRVLGYLLDHLSITNNDCLVDFGCGTGRFLFYSHYHWQIPCVGIEFHPQAFEALAQNYHSYYYGNPQSQENIQLVKENAINYQIQPEHTIFYFFNPFSIEVFKAVLMKIQISIRTYPRSVHLILYYPHASYLHFIEEHSNFRLSQRLRLPWTQAAREEILFYTYKENV